MSRYIISVFSRLFLKALLAAFCITLVPFKGQCQYLIPFNFTSEEDNRYLKEDDSLKYYVASGDSTLIVGLDDEANVYKLLSKTGQVIAEGGFIADGDKFLQTGRWVERYNNGRVKAVGCYRRNKPIGTWREYYNDGSPKVVCNYAVVVNDKGGTNYCLSGTWEEYYKGGKLRVSGCYMASETKEHDTIVVDDPINDSKVSKVISRVTYKPEKTGQWEYFDANGELTKKEEY